MAWFIRAPSTNELLKQAIEAMHSTALATARAAEVQAQSSLEASKALQLHLELFKAPHPAPSVTQIDRVDRAQDEYSLAELLRTELSPGDDA